MNAILKKTILSPGVIFVLQIIFYVLVIHISPVAQFGTTLNIIFILLIVWGLVLAVSNFKKGKEKVGKMDYVLSYLILIPFFFILMVTVLTHIYL